MENKKIAVVLMNLGGPTSLKEVKPFLFRIFFDKRIINLPFVFRWILAKLISTLRNKKAIEIYKKIGGKSPILENTEKQKNKLEKILKEKNIEFKVFIAMRHSKPFTEDAVTAIKKFSPDEIILLPLYPHFSSTTTLSSFEKFEKEKNKIESLRNIKIKKICCYYGNKKFIASQVELINEELVKSKVSKKDIRILFSAHSLPSSIIKNGDPYQWQIEKNASLIMTDESLKDMDWVVCYQSKVGYNKWLSPATEDEIKRAAKDGVGIIIVPISFVSEHSETLVELDIYYKMLAQKQNIKHFLRVKTQGDDNIFIESLKSICLKSSDYSKGISQDMICPNKYCFCIKNGN
jgi:ferrochelatase